MKPVNRIFLIACIIGGMRAHAQSGDTTYFNAKWEETDREHASFYRPPAELKDGRYHFADYFMSGKVQMTGSFANKSCSIEDGYFTHYDSLGNKTYEGMIRNGNRTGTWRFYFPGTERLSRAAAYETDMLNGSMIINDSASGMKKAEGAYCMNLKCGKWLEYYPGTDKVRFEIYRLEGKLDGTMKSFYPDGKLKRRDIYESGQFVSGTCFDREGKKIKHIPFYESPQFDGDVIDFVRKRIHFPAEAAQNHVYGFVRVSFTVEKTGRLTNIKVVKGIGSGCDEEAIRIMQLMPAWKPARLEGEIIEEEIVRGISFPFKTEFVD